MTLPIIKNKKTLGILIIIPTILLLAWSIIFSVVITLFGMGSGVNFIALLPFLGLTLIKIVILSLAFQLALKLIKEKSAVPQNKNLSILLIVIGILYFAQGVFAVLYNNITGLNPGGWAQSVLAFLWGLILVLVGMGVKKNT
ncbi:hypothetical protein KJ641_02475 [Patescibacteria group bacterium]|nr:hypothetical protein [Patescibacteria group bacterium]